MECDYEEGECSVCHKKVKNRGDDCIHLKKHKGKDYRGKPVYEILHNITFTGLGLLDRAGADEEAKILTVATNKTMEDSHMSENNDPGKDGITTPPEKGDISPSPEAKHKDQSEKIKVLQSEADEKDVRIKELESELAKLTKDFEKAQKLIESMEKEKQAAKQKAKAETLLKQWEKMGRSFESEKDREKEIQRLAGLSEEALGAIEETIGSFDSMKSRQTEEEIEKKEASDKKKKSQANRKAQANIKPESIDDAEFTLHDELKNGFVAAYQSRIGE